MNLLLAYPLFLRLRTGQLGAGWMLVAALLFAWMSVFVKWGAERFSATELLFYRTLIGWVGIGTVLAIRRQPLGTHHIGAHLKRSAAGYLSLLLYFYALVHLPIATAVTLNYTSSLFFALLCVWLLRERLSARVSLALVLGFAGIIVLLKPTLSGDAWFAGVMGLGSGLSAGLAVFQVRELGKLGEPEWRTVFFFTGFCTLMGLGTMLFLPVHPLSPESLGPLLGIGVTATLGQLAMTRAYREGQKFLVATFGYVTVVFSALLGLLFWGDPLGLDALLAIGLIIFSGVLAAKR
ncbi:Uncharacterized membrane protein [Gulbenkiania indica]|uniref:Uncharacterized membrane protein n=1 Tax=Gulbenkiania indica TaxID=375574 RepID=A0A0K6H5Q7_9NEIS|nr:DMT family transporter [Gulbenkiania indica]CUA86325.1 Uncharacterized membrane protein [Gulbenkiania indica]